MTTPNHRKIGKRLLLFLAAAATAQAVGTVQQSTQQVGNSGIYTVALYWTGDSINGTVPVTLVQSQSIPLVQGYRVVNMETTPGSPAPTNNYSIALLDAAGVDVMAGAASANVSSSSPQGFVGSPNSPPIFGSVSLSITGQSVAGAKGTVFVYLAPFSQVIGLAPTAPSFPSQGPNLFYASPNGASGSPGFRAFALGDLGANVVGLANGGTGVTTAQGNGAKVQLSTGTTTSQDCVKFDANGNTVDSGAACSSVALPSGTQTQFLRLQPNTGNNTTTQFASKDLVNVVDYNFPAYSCNGSLVCAQGGPTGGTISPGPTTITMNPCPLGVAGANTWQNLYISGGSGTAEAVLITSGTCTSGASTGTVVFTAVNSHSGAFTVASATAGVQEAANVSPSIFIPDGTYQFFAAATFRGDSSVYCNSNHAQMAANFATQNMFVSINTLTFQRFRVTNCFFGTNVTKTAGDAIQLNGSGGVSNRGAIIDGVLCEAMWNCVHSVSGGNWSIVSTQSRAGQNYDVYVQNTNGTDSGDNSIVNCFFDNSNANLGAGIRWESGGGLYVSNTKILNHLYGINIAAADGVNTSDFLIENDSIELYAVAGIQVNRLGTTGLVQTVIIQGNQIATGLANTYGIFSGTGTTNIAILNNIVSPTLAGIFVTNTTGAVIDHNRVQGATNGIQLSTGNAGQISVLQNQISGATTPYSGAATFMDTINSLTLATLNSGAWTPANGTVAYCSDCNANATAGSSTGAVVARQNGAWVPISFWPNTVVGGSVASAASITPTDPMFHVTGVAAIATINLPSGFVAGCITIIPDGLWSTNATGNIALATTAVVSKTLFECYDPNSSKWYPSY